jgi:hypothetical protein
MLLLLVVLLVFCISLVLSIPLSVESSSSEVSSSDEEYNNIVNMINSINDKKMATLLLEVVNYASGTKKSTTTTISSSGSSSSSSSSNSSLVEYDHLMFNRLLQSSSSIKVSFFYIGLIGHIYINGVEVSQPAYFNPANDTLAIRGSNSNCALDFDDVRLSFSFVQNHLRCTTTAGNFWESTVPNEWFAKDYNDSNWASTLVSSSPNVPPTWSLAGVSGAIFCRFHNEGLICKDGSEPYEGQCWCGKGYKSSTGLAPCEPCGDNSYTSTIGSTKCICSANAISINGYDTPNSCETCKDGSEKYGDQCWCSRGYKSSTGLAPCEPCEDNSFTDALGSKMCKCAANTFSITGYDNLNSCQECPG